MIALWGLSAFVLVLGYLGALHPAGDSFAVLRLPSSLAVAVLAALALGGLARIGAVLVGFSVAAHILWGAWVGSGTSQGDYAILQHNLGSGRVQSGPWVEQLSEHAPDFVTLQEAPRGMAPTFDTLADRYPTQLFCPFFSTRDVGVLSRWPSVEGSQICAEGLAAMQVETPDGKIWVVSIHLRWPWPLDQAGQVGALLPILERLEGRVLLGGDFNNMVWSRAMTSLAQAAKGEIARPYMATYFRAGLRFPIDHVLLPEGTSEYFKQRVDGFGSYHHGVLVSFSVPKS